MSSEPATAAQTGAMELRGPTGPSKYYRARYYDPKAGRFISEDPIRFRGGINFYAYVKNNPVNHADPSGLDSYSCRSGIDSAPWLPIDTHAYICVTDPSGKRTCQGLVPGDPSATGMMYSGGKWDPYDGGPKACQQVKAPFSSPSCIDNCLLEKFQQSPPGYSRAGIVGENCNTWANNAVADCITQCVQGGPPSPRFP